MKPAPHPQYTKLQICEQRSRPRPRARTARSIPLVAICVAHILAFALPTGVLRAQTTAVCAEDFLNSTGVCIHLKQGIDTEANVTAALDYTGIRNFRDDGSTSSSVIQSWINIHNATGAKALILASRLQSNLTPFMGTWTQLAQAGALLAIEGPNEPNNWPVTYDNQYSGGSLMTTTSVATVNNSARYGTAYSNETASGFGSRSNGPLSFKYASGTAFVTTTTTGVRRNDYSGWVGFKFTTGNATVVVTELARWVVSGNTQTHAVRLVKASDGSVLGTVSIATAGAPAGAFKYASLSTSVTLAANTAYYLMSQETSGGDYWHDGQYNSLPVAWLQRDLYAAVKGNSTLSGYPVFSSSTASGSQPNNCGLQYLTIPTPAPSGVLMPAGTEYADFANMHNYVCNNFADVQDNNAWNASEPLNLTGYATLYDEFGHTWWSPGFVGYSNAELQTLPRVTTETGWYTAASPNHTKPITEEKQGRLFLNLYFSAFKRGWSATFIYMLRDDANQGYWGLYKTNWTPKASATYLHNLTTILDDSGLFTPDALDYSIPSQPSTVHDLLLQKSDGRFFLAVWNEKASGSNTVSVNLGTAQASVKVYDPTVGTTPIQTLSDVTSVSLTLSDHPVILELPAPSTGPWETSSVGNVAVEGYATYAGDQVTVYGAGSDIGGTADSFQYVYQMATGDCSITARIDSVQNTSSLAKAGIMIRETLAPGSKHATVFSKPGQGGLYFRWRAATGGASSHSGISGGAPFWLRLTRSGNTFTAATSPDNVTWTQLYAPQTISMAATVYIGLAEVSATSSLGAAAFSGVSVDSGLSVIDFNTHPLSSYATQDSANGSTEIQDAGATLKMTGNLWKKIALPYTITANTVLEFDFKAGSTEGEIHGIGVDIDNGEAGSGSAIFQVHGTQVWSNQTYNNYQGSGWVHYTIPIGNYTTGAKEYLLFISDKDQSPFTCESWFRNVRLHE